MRTYRPRPGSNTPEHPPSATTETGDLESRKRSAYGTPVAPHQPWALAAHTRICGMTADDADRPEPRASVGSSHWRPDRPTPRRAHRRRTDGDHRPARRTHRHHQLRGRHHPGVEPHGNRKFLTQVRAERHVVSGVRPGDNPLVLRRAACPPDQRRVSQPPRVPKRPRCGHQPLVRMNPRLSW